MATISASFSVSPTAANPLNGMMQAAMAVQSIRRITDPNISEAMKQEMMKPFLEHNQVVEDEYARESEEKKVTSAVASAGKVSDAVEAAAARASAEAAAPQKAADGSPVPPDAAPAAQAVSTYTPDAQISESSAVGTTVDTYA
jgi:hypothetical protein